MSGPTRPAPLVDAFRDSCGHVAFRSRSPSLPSSPSRPRPLRPALLWFADTVGSFLPIKQPLWVRGHLHNGRPSRSQTADTINSSVLSGQTLCGASCAASAVAAKQSNSRCGWAFPQAGTAPALLAHPEREAMRPDTAPTSCARVARTDFPGALFAGGDHRHCRSFAFEYSAAARLRRGLEGLCQPSC